MKRFIFLLLVILSLLFTSSAFADYVPLEIKNGDSVSICAGDFYELVLISDSGKEMEWSSSNEDIFMVLPNRNDVIIAAGLGSANLIGKAKDGSGKSVKIKITVPKVYTTHDSIVIDTPEGVEFGYRINLSGYNYISKSGKSTRTERLDDVGRITMCKILPVKVGTDTYIFENNGRRVKTVKIEVKKSAFETPAVLPAGTSYAVVTKNVNIRKGPDAESKRMGSANQGDKLIVT